MLTTGYDLSPDRVFYTSGPKDSGGRSMGISKRRDGSQVSVLLEWRSSAPTTTSVAGLGARHAAALQDIPNDEDVNRREEVRTLKFEGLLTIPGQSRSAFVYECPRKPVNLREVLVKLAKPSSAERRALAGAIATQVRSLIVHFGVRHAALRTESFIFFDNGMGRPALADPYLLDWGRPRSPSIHLSPDYRVGEIHWYYDAWSLMMIIYEIAKWRPIDETGLDANELPRKRVQIKEMVMDDATWEDERTAKIMQYGFKFIDRDRAAFESLSRKDIKRFFDRLCNLIDSP